MFITSKYIILSYITVFLKNYKKKAISLKLLFKINFNNINAE